VEATSFGTANDLVGSLGTTFMIPVALVLSAWLPDRPTSRVIRTPFWYLFLDRHLARL